MIYTNYIECGFCNKEFCLRIDGPEFSEDSYSFGCVKCSNELNIKITKINNGIDFNSNDCTVVKNKKIKLENINVNELLSISTHFPVHRKAQKNIKLTSGGSPRLYFSLHDMKGTKKYLDLLSYFVDLKNKQYKHHAELINFAERNEWASVKGKISRMYPERRNLEFLPSRDVISMYYKILFSTHKGIVDDTGRMYGLYKEYFEELNTCLSNYRNDYLALMQIFKNAHNYSDNRLKLFSIHKRLIQKVETYSGGYLYEYASDELKNKINEFRLFRTDFDTVKVLFVDIFEHFAKTSLYAVMILNLSRRGDINNFSGKSGMTVEKFKKLTTYAKVEYLRELPLIYSLIQNVSRGMRNDIGHFSARYDYKEGNIIFDTGEVVNYVIFLNDFLQAIKSMTIIYKIYEKIDMDIELK